MKIRLNEELTKFHKEVLCNLNSIHGALAYEPEVSSRKVQTALSSGTGHIPELAEEDQKP